MTTPNLNEPLDRAVPGVDLFLEKLQGNILKSHGRDHVSLLIINFGPSNEATDPTAAKAWIHLVAETKITNALEQERQSERFKADSSQVAIFQSLAFSSRGYEFLSLKRPKDGAFRDGMQKRGPILNDRPVGEWERPYQLESDEVHALLIIAASNRAIVDREAHVVRGEISAFGGRVLIEERGDQQRDGNDEPIEHFGYRDGVSQPNLVKNPSPPANPKFDQDTRPRRILAEDPSGRDRFGSYLVYRKLEQNVKGFNDAVGRVATATNKNEELVGAMAIGRFKDGTPLVGSQTPSGNRGDDSDFNYDTDPDGRQCPFHAHIRKVNPRGEIPFLVNILANEKKRRIARRAITYGERAAGDAPESAVGLLFMCYQNDIADQFEFIQDRWANSRNFLKRNTGLDPVIGQSKKQGHDSREFANWPTAGGANIIPKINFGQFVQLMGGEYFFVPSMETLQTI